MPTHLSLFSGIGGIDLAAHKAGFETVAFCEREPFCQRVLARHWPGVPCFDDVRTLTAQSLRSRGIHRGIDLLSGGYPCQPFSLAGKGEAEKDPRHLWPEMRRLVGEFRPAWVLGENVLGHLNRGLDDVLLDLGTLGYETRVFVFPAQAIGACHLRTRLFIVGHPRGQGLPIPEPEAFQGPWGGAERGAASQPGPGPAQSGVVRDVLGLPDRVDGSRHPRIAPPGPDQFPWEPPRTCSGPRLKNRVGRIKGLGNAVDPWQVLPILVAIRRQLP